MFSPTRRPAPSSTARGRSRNTSIAGSLGGASASSSASSNIGVSATRLRMYQPTATSSAESRNGTRQPQAMKSASLWKPAISARIPADSRLPSGTPACGQLAQKPRRFGIAIFGRHQHRAAPLAADREALDDAEHDEPDRRPHADARVAGQQADQHGREPHQHQAQHQQFLAPDAVAEMAEDDPAERPRDEADGIGGEGEQRPDQRVERAGRTTC